MSNPKGATANPWYKRNMQTKLSVGLYMLVSTKNCISTGFDQAQNGKSKEGTWKWHTSPFNYFVYQASVRVNNLDTVTPTVIDALSMHTGHVSWDLGYGLLIQRFEKQGKEVPKEETAAAAAYFWFSGINWIGTDLANLI